VTPAEIILYGIILGSGGHAVGWYVSSSGLNQPIMTEIGRRLHQEVIEIQDEFGQVAQRRFIKPVSFKAGMTWKGLTCAVCVAWQFALWLTVILVAIGERGLGDGLWALGVAFAFSRFAARL